MNETSIVFENHTSNFTSMITEDERRYDPTKYTRICAMSVEKEQTPIGAFMAFTYGSSLRFKVLFDSNIEDEDFMIVQSKIREYQNAGLVEESMLWYAILNEEIDREQLSSLLEADSVEYFREYAIDRDAMKMHTVENSRHEETFREYNQSLLADCIEILESAFTPKPDPPGTFITDKPNIDTQFKLRRNAMCLLLYLYREPIGLVNYADGVLDYVAVKKEYQGRGYGSLLIERAISEALINTNSGLKLFCRDDNMAAHQL